MKPDALIRLNGTYAGVWRYRKPKKTQMFIYNKFEVSVGILSIIISLIRSYT